MFIFEIVILVWIKMIAMKIVIAIDSLIAKWLLAYLIVFGRWLHL